MSSRNRLLLVPKQLLIPTEDLIKPSKILLKPIAKGGTSKFGKFASGSQHQDDHLPFVIRDASIPMQSDEI